MMAEGSVSTLKPDQCAVCSTTADLKACASCLSVWYCSKDHQVKHWKELHKLDCKKRRQKDLELTTCFTKMNLETTNSNGEIVATAKTLGSSEKRILSTKDEKLHPLRVERPLDIIAGHLTLAGIQKQAQQIVTCLNQFGIAVINNFLGGQLSESILTDVRGLHQNGLMEDGQTTANVDETTQKYRTDQIVWVNGTESACRSIGTLINCVDGVVKSARSQLKEYEIQGRTQAMVACYPGYGTRYVRHVDNPNKDGRCLTCIYYINKNWNCKEDGGILKIYPEYSAGRVASIEPIIDRLLVFWSDKRNPHEVLPAYKTRYAVTVWYFDHNERSQATSASIISASNQSVNNSDSLSQSQMS